MPTRDYDPINEIIEAISTTRTWPITKVTTDTKGNIFVSPGSTHDYATTNPNAAHVTKKEPVNPFAIRSVLSNRRKNAFSVVWMDGTTTVVHCQPGDDWDDEKALAMCFTKKALGNKGNFNDKFNDALDNKMKVIKSEKEVIKEEVDIWNETLRSPVNKEAATNASLTATIGLSKEAQEFLNALEKSEVKRYDLFLMDPCGDKTKIYHQGTDEEIHKAMRTYRTKHYPILEANRTPYRVWMVKDDLMVDFGAGSYFMVPGMDHDTFVKRK